ncbi:uncharacterized protein SAPINGB_P002993 [Magnusiomyces paraingens]|uniref:tRNA wybutosine-synthesizing protein 3 n=1 Tax=Magnusiomyces paraingens TaxID=2606893 RepID=A0A5E8BNC3_9ASCO|nr:uncharacterized protein SAPINGB_P002993 [Saprochaete ingens]VVT51128.1 unnamed protein product [Saprochaete ingens]
MAKKQNDPFGQKKKHILQQLEQTDVEHPDASPKGTVDVPLLPLIHLINSHPDMVTTSSCSGRVSVFLEGDRVVPATVAVTASEGSENADTRAKIGGKGAGGKWIFVTHDPTELDTDAWLKQVKEYHEENPLAENTVKRYLQYKFEAMILHVKCRDLATAQKLYTIAMGCGFRETGIGSNDLVGIRISIRLDVPLGYLDTATGRIHLLVPDDYIRELDEMSLARFQENARRRDTLYAKIEKNMFVDRE